VRCARWLTRTLAGCPAVPFASRRRRGSARAASAACLALPQLFLFAHAAAAADVPCIMAACRAALAADAGARVHTAHAPRTARVSALSVP
jgi:hypothetical protein